EPPVDALDLEDLAGGDGARPAELLPARGRRGEGGGDGQDSQGGRDAHGGRSFPRVRGCRMRRCEGGKGWSRFHDIVGACAPASSPAPTPGSAGRRLGGWPVSDTGSASPAATRSGARRAAEPS